MTCTSESKPSSLSMLLAWLDLHKLQKGFGLASLDLRKTAQLAVRSAACLSLIASDDLRAYPVGTAADACLPNS